jgi:hypothetical protein
MRSAWQIGSVIAIGLWAAAGPSGRSASVQAAARRQPQQPMAQALRRGPGHSAAAVPPDILLTGATRETRAVEARAAGFVRAVRRRDGARAARFLSRQTAPPVRAAVARRDWPWRTASQDLGLLFARRDLRLRTLALWQRRARVRIGLQHRNPSSMEAVGFYDLGMVREGARWQVTLPQLAAPRAGTRRKR